MNLNLYNQSMADKEKYRTDATPVSLNAVSGCKIKLPILVELTPETWHSIYMFRLENNISSMGSHVTGLRLP